MISKTIGFRGTRHFQTHPYDKEGLPCKGVAANGFYLHRIDRSINKGNGCLAAPRRVNEWFFSFFLKFASRCGFGVMHCLFHLNQGFKFTAFCKAFCSSFQICWFFPCKISFFFLRSEKKFVFYFYAVDIYIHAYIYIHIYIYIYMYLSFYLSIYLCMYVCMYVSILLSIYPSIYMFVHRTINFVMSMRDNDTMSNDESASSFLRL